MYSAEVEIFSDTTNSAILWHPGRKFPGDLIQGDSLYNLCLQADDACAEARKVGAEDAFKNMNKLRNSLWSYLSHYKSVLDEHDIRLPFSEQPLL